MGNVTQIKYFGSSDMESINDFLKLPYVNFVSLKIFTDSGFYLIYEEIRTCRFCKRESFDYSNEICRECHSRSNRNKNFEPKDFKEVTK